MKRIILTYLTTIAATLVCSGPAGATIVSINAGRDNSIFSDQVTRSSGAGYTIHTGNSGGTGGVRRGLVWFDVAGNVPADATIVSAQLTMYLYDSATQGPTTSNVSLYLLQADWGEGASNSTGNHGIGMGTGMGAPAQTNDATWNKSFFNTISWTTAGGDFAGTLTASQSIGIPTDIVSDDYSWQSAQLTADVQAWLDTPSQNFGWIIRGDEATSFTTRRFFSHEFPFPNAVGPSGESVYLGPQLTINYLEASAVPEPTAGVLIALGAMLLVAWRSRNTFHWRANS